MARNNTGLKKPMPNKASFIYGSTGERQQHGGKKIKGGDLRSRPGNNDGRMK